MRPTPRPFVRWLYFNGVAASGLVVQLGLLAWLVQKPAVRGFYDRYQPAMEVAFGALFVLFAARLLLGELAAWL